MAISTVGANGLNKTEDFTIDGLTVGNGTGSKGSVLGYQAGNSNTTGTGLTTVGYQAGYTYNTTGENWYSTFLGYFAGKTTTTGKDNTFVGGYAGYYNTTGSSNIAIGGAALLNNTTASNNTAVGYQAGYSNTTGENNTFMGWKSGYSVTGAGTGNTFVGRYSGYGSTTSDTNTFIGQNSGYLVTTGNKNTIIGSYSGNQSGLDIRTSNNIIVLSDGDGNPRAYWDSSGVGYFYNTAYYGGASPRVSPNTDNVGYIGDNTHRWQAVYAVNGTIQTSDATQKTNVENTDLGLDFVSALRPVKFNWIDSEYGRTHYGFIAQEIEKTLKDKNAGDFGGLVIDKNEDGSDFYGLRHHELIAPLVKAIQELNAKVTELEAKLGAK